MITYHRYALDDVIQNGTTVSRTSSLGGTAHCPAYDNSPNHNLSYYTLVAIEPKITFAEIWIDIQIFPVKNILWKLLCPEVG